MYTRLGVATIAGVLMVLLSPAIGHAEGTSCSFPTVVVPDGRIMESTIPNGSTFWFLFDTDAGRSYSIEIKDPLEAWGNFPGSLTVFATGSCFGTDPIMSTENIAPEIPNTARRVSLTTTAGRQRFTLQNTSGGTRPYSISVSETTMFSPRWSTFGGFFTSWGFHNTTSTSLTGTLKVNKNDGTVLANPTFSIPAGTVVFKDTRPTDLNLAAQQAGSATFTHNGPPGAIQADVFFLNSAATVVVPGEFRAVREATH